MASRGSRIVQSNPEDSPHRGDQARSKAGFDNHTLKEIREQPTAIRHAIRGRVNTLQNLIEFDTLDSHSFQSTDQVQFVAEGSSYHAAQYAVAILKRHGVFATATLAGEYSAHPYPTTDDSLIIGVSQSGSTDETVEATREAGKNGAHRLAVTSDLDSPLTATCENAIGIRAGREAGAGATKSFSAELVALSLLAEQIIEGVCGVGTPARRSLLGEIAQLPGNAQRVIDESPAEVVASDTADCDSYFFIGQGVGRSIADEAARKVTELAFEHAEAFGASELPHGPAALITESTPVFGIVTHETDTKTIDALREARALDAPTIAIGPEHVKRDVRFVDHFLTIPRTCSDCTAVLAAIHAQLFAYELASRLNRSFEADRVLPSPTTAD